MHIPLIYETYVSFVYECSGLEGVTFSLPAHITARKPVEFLIDQRIQLVQCGLVSVAPLDEELGDLLMLSGRILLQYATGSATKTTLRATIKHKKHKRFFKN